MITYHFSLRYGHGTVPLMILCAAPILCRYVISSSGEPDNHDEPSNMEDVYVGLHEHTRFQRLCEYLYM